VARSPDYSQIELRLLAHMSDDPLLVEAYRNGDDIHTLTAAEVLGIHLLTRTLFGQMLSQVHDELVFECPPEEMDAISKLAKREMEGASQLKVPVVVDIGSGENWRDAKRLLITQAPRLGSRQGRMRPTTFFARPYTYEIGRSV
jgi:DNA polymerase I-like protein with 3'-5' exonuclease and polymerase domains